MLTWFKYFDQKSDNFLFKNVSIFHKNMSQGGKCFNTPIFYATTVIHNMRESEAINLLESAVLEKGGHV